MNSKNGYKYELNKIAWMCLLATLFVLVLFGKNPQ
jgi:hypothetical protein